jgi:excisionase family DNA binding protein
MTIPNQATRKLIDPATLEALRRAQEQFPLISMQEASKQYGVPIRTLRRWQADGKMPDRVVRPGKRYMYDKAAVELYISRNRRPDKAQEL